MKSNRSSIALHFDTKERFDEAKPFDSMSADDFVDSLLDVYENETKEKTRPEGPTRTRLNERIENDIAQGK